MDCKADDSCNLKIKLRLASYDVINTKEQTAINSIKDALEGEDMLTQYTVSNFEIDLYFHKYKQTCN